MSDLAIESVNFPDPFWLEHGDQIRKMNEYLEVPKTSAGELSHLTLFTKNPILKTYGQLNPIFFGVITLIECDEIGKFQEKNYFAESVNQEIALKATKLLIEDAIKRPYSSAEDKKYGDYRNFFEGSLFRLGQLGKQIQQGQILPNFVNSVAMIISQETNELGGIVDFDLETKKIRAKIADYLPQFAKIENGKLLSTVSSLLETSFVNAKP